jgi:hypothetical protein
MCLKKSYLKSDLWGTVGCLSFDYCQLECADIFAIFCPCCWTG